MIWRPNLRGSAGEFPEPLLKNPAPKEFFELMLSKLEEARELMNGVVKSAEAMAETTSSASSSSSTASDAAHAAAVATLPAAATTSTEISTASKESTPSSPLLPLVTIHMDANLLAVPSSTAMAPSRCSTKCAELEVDGDGDVVASKIKSKASTECMEHVFSPVLAAPVSPAMDVEPSYIHAGTLTNCSTKCSSLAEAVKASACVPDTASTTPLNRMLPLPDGLILSLVPSRSMPLVHANIDVQQVFDKMPRHDASISSYNYNKSASQNIPNATSPSMLTITNYSPTPSIDVFLLQQYNIEGSAYKVSENSPPTFFTTASTNMHGMGSYLQENQACALNISEVCPVSDRPPWPPPIQMKIIGNGTETRPAPWPSFNYYLVWCSQSCYPSSRKWKLNFEVLERRPPWPPPLEAVSVQLEEKPAMLMRSTRNWWSYIECDLLSWFDCELITIDVEMVDLKPWPPPICSSSVVGLQLVCSENADIKGAWIFLVCPWCTHYETTDTVVDFSLVVKLSQEQYELYNVKMQSIVLKLLVACTVCYSRCSNKKELIQHFWRPHTISVEEVGLPWLNSLTDIEVWMSWDPRRLTLTCALIAMATLKILVKETEISQIWFSYKEGIGFHVADTCLIICITTYIIS